MDEHIFEMVFCIYETKDWDANVIDDEMTR